MSMALSWLWTRSIKNFLLNWVARFGSPIMVTTDRGQQFESSLFASTMKYLGCQRHRTAAYHPQANGMVERFHRQLKASLMAHANSQRWMENLPIVLLGLRSTLKPDIGFAPAELVYGNPLRLPGEMFCTQQDQTRLQALIERIRSVTSAVPLPAPRPQSPPSYIDPKLQTCTHVFVRCDKVRQPLIPPYDGPFRVLSRTPKVFELDLNGRHDRVSIDRLKPAFTEVNEQRIATHPTPLPVPAQTTTRSGRRVHFPDRLEIGNVSLVSNGG